VVAVAQRREVAHQHAGLAARNRDAQRLGEQHELRIAAEPRVDRPHVRRERQRLLDLARELGLLGLTHPGVGVIGGELHRERRAAVIGQHHERARRREVRAPRERGGAAANATPGSRFSGCRGSST
jgi:hypothetical protein